MSRHLEKLGNNEFKELVDNLNKCRWLYDEICCNGLSDMLADFPSDEDCSRCVLFTKERRSNGKRRKKT